MTNRKYYIAAIIILLILNIMLIVESQRKVKRERILTAQLMEHEKLNSKYLESVLIRNNLHTAIKNNKNKVQLFYFLEKSRIEKAYKAEIFFLDEMIKKFPEAVTVYYNGTSSDTLPFSFSNDLQIINWVKRDVNLRCSFALLKDKNNILQNTYIINPGYPSEFSMNLTSIASMLNSVYDK